jgi:hypothetical protein
MAGATVVQNNTSRGYDAADMVENGTDAAAVMPLRTHEQYSNDTVCALYTAKTGTDIP